MGLRQLQLLAQSSNRSYAKPDNVFRCRSLFCPQPCGLSRAPFQATENCYLHICCHPPAVWSQACIQGAATTGNHFRSSCFPLSSICHKSCIPPTFSDAPLRGIAYSAHPPTFSRQSTSSVGEQPSHGCLRLCDSFADLSSVLL